MARRNIRIKPGRTQSAMGFVVGVIFVCVGLFVVVPAFGLFGLLWTGIAVAITVVNGMNAFGKKGVPTMEIYTEEEEPKPEVKSTRFPPIPWMPRAGWNSWRA